jgi:hypothetical protein
VGLGARSRTPVFDHSLHHASKDQKSGCSELSVEEKSSHREARFISGQCRSASANASPPTKKGVCRRSLLKREAERFQTFESTSDFGCSSVPWPTRTWFLHIAVLVEKAALFGTDAGQAKVGVVPVASSAEELPEAVPSFPRPVRVPFCGGEPDVGVAANVSSKVAPTISRDLNTYKRLKDRVVTERSVCGVRSRRSEMPHGVRRAPRMGRNASPANL